MFMRIKFLNMQAPVNDGTPSKSVHAKTYPTLSRMINTQQIKDVMTWVDYCEVYPASTLVNNNGRNKDRQNTITLSGARTVVSMADGETLVSPEVFDLVEIRILTVNDRH